MTKDPLSSWKSLALDELKGKPLESLNWITPENITIKALYTRSDVETVSHLNELPGLANFSRGPRTHGSKNHRLPGSIGAGSTPGRVYPGKQKAGHLGNTTVTLKKTKVLREEVRRDQKNL